MKTASRKKRKISSATREVQGGRRLHLEGGGPGFVGAPLAWVVPGSVGEVPVRDRRPNCCCWPAWTVWTATSQRGRCRAGSRCRCSRCRPVTPSVRTCRTRLAMSSPRIRCPFFEIWMVQYLPNTIEPPALLEGLVQRSGLQPCNRQRRHSPIGMKRDIPICIYACN